ncbi:MAG TPA: hypothetical protein VFG15_16075 [Amycolatopsis sp.]|nr:hypothetical protein [Amycolatopsis sp.]
MIAAVGVKLDFGTGKTIDATVADGTFGVRMPDGVSQDYERAGKSAAGATLHQGTLPLY